MKISQGGPRQGVACARARWATALGLTSKLGLIPKIFKALIWKTLIYLYIQELKRLIYLK
jgi:hypothetical protein